MTMAYSYFGNTTGKHGLKISRRLRQILKIYRAQMRRHKCLAARPAKHQQRPEHNRRCGWARHYGYAHSRHHKGR